MLTGLHLLFLFFYLLHNFSTFSVFGFKMDIFLADTRLPRVVRSGRKLLPVKVHTVSDGKRVGFHLLQIMLLKKRGNSQMQED